MQTPLIFRRFRRIILVRSICVVLCVWYFLRQVAQIQELAKTQDVARLDQFKSDNDDKRQQRRSTKQYVLGLPMDFHSLTGSSTNQSQQTALRNQIKEFPSTTATQNDRNYDTTPSPLVVDILSVGSATRLDYIQAQQETFGSHVIVRNFFNVTELDDPDQNCSTTLKFKDVKQISTFCKQKRWHPQRQFLMSYLTASYASSTWLSKKSNPAGWLCAQNRPALGLYKVLQYYRQQQSVEGESLSSTSKLPDYLITMDDDTYFNMDLFENQFSSSSSSIPLGMAGCMIRSPIRSINFTIPFGGFGFIMSQGYIQRMMKPIRCENDIEMCKAIMDTNHINEKSLFREGMSLVDLIYSYATNQPYTSYKRWTTGFCLHSDWLFGYITNFYNVSRHVTDPIFANVPHARMEAYMGSELYAGNTDQGGRGNCDFENDYCHSMSHACHYSNPQQMQRITQTIMQRVPHKFQQSPLIPNDDHRNGIKNTGETLVTLKPSKATRIVVDILSIAATNNNELLLAQKETFASHSSVRNFFNITPADQFDRHCSETLTEQDIEQISSWCQSYAYNNTQRTWLAKGLRGLHGKKLEREHRAAWLCAQTRPIQGFYNVIQHYRATGQDLPDYFLIVRDDTYYNIEALQELILNSPKNYANTSIPWAIAGCRMQMDDYPFTAPMDGFGFLISHATLQNLMRPIYCSKEAIDRRPYSTSSQCTMLQSNDTTILGEGTLFQEGMSLVDLMYAYSTRNQMTKYQEWTSAGFCLRSDWLWGYFINYYNMSQHVSSPKLVDTPHARIEAYMRSRYASPKKVEKLCRNRGLKQCHVDALFCSRVNIEVMRNYTFYTRKLYPGLFRTS